MKIFSSYSLLLLVSLSLFICPIVRSDDNTDDSDEDAVINEESAQNNEENVETQTAAETEADEETGESVTSSPYVKTNVLFIEPESTELPAGRLVKLLVGFHNNGTNNFVVDQIDGSFRYPQDFSYYIQNFSIAHLNKIIESDKEATFQYMFTPSETFSSRQFGLTINLRYRDLEGKSFVNAIFNDTVNIVEPEEGLDGETFFLYIFLAAIVALLLLAAQQFLTVFKKKGRSKASTVSSSQKSNGRTLGPNDVDLEWIPKEHLQSKDGNKSPKVSPRQRKANTRTNGNTVSAGGNSSNDEQ